VVKNGKKESVCIALHTKQVENCGIMYVILVYDVEQKRTAKMLKLCRRYLHWIQNSVFEGEITEAKLQELIHRARRLIDPETDSLIIFTSRHERWLDKQIIGKEKSSTDNFL
jgi:CRISPR-associated protein Cas2